jgi:hypothetical protein
VKSTALLIVLAATFALTAPAGANLSKKAYFDVSIAGTQQVTWTRALTFRECGGTGTQNGKGSADLTFGVGNKHWVEARRVPGDRVATIEFEGELGPIHPTGTFRRYGEFSGSSTVQPSAQCPKPDPPRSDCGTLDLPADAQLGIAYISPASWPSWRYLGHPKSMSLVLNGPVSPTWAGMPFKFCPGVAGDDSLGGVWAAFNQTPAYAGPAKLPLSLLFGRKKHFKIHWHDHGKDDQYAGEPLPSSWLSASEPIETAVDWTVRFSRRAHPPGGG